jgi:hypothetical protein
VRALRRRWLRWRPVAAAFGLAAALVLLAHPLAGAASDLFGNVAPASQLPPGGLADRYPLAAGADSASPGCISTPILMTFWHAEREAEFRPPASFQGSAE